MQKLFYAIFLLLALGLIYIGLQSGESGGDLEAGQQQAGVQEFESPPPPAEFSTPPEGSSSGSTSDRSSRSSNNASAILIVEGSGAAYLRNLDLGGMSPEY